MLLTDKSSATVHMAIKQHLVAHFGTPACIRTDNGTEFAGAVKEWCSAYGVKHKHSSPYTSHSMGQVERYNRSIEQLLRRCLVTVPTS